MDEYRQRCRAVNRFQGYCLLKCPIHPSIFFRVRLNFYFRSTATRFKASLVLTLPIGRTAGSCRKQPFDWLMPVLATLCAGRWRSRTENAVSLPSTCMSLNIIYCVRTVPSSSSIRFFVRTKPKGASHFITPSVSKKRVARLASLLEVEAQRHRVGTKQQLIGEEHGTEASESD